MKRALFIIMTLVALALSGCATKTGSATAGALGGAAGGAGAYEYRLHEEQKRIEDDYKAGRIDKREYDIRKDEIQRMMLIK